MLVYLSNTLTPTQCSTPQELLNFITNINLEKDFSEVSNVLRIVLTTPVIFPEEGASPSFEKKNARGKKMKQRKMEDEK